MNIKPQFGNNFIKRFSKGGFILIKKVEICGVNTSKLPVLSNEEKNALFIKIKEGDKAAREEFINGNLKLVLSVIRKFNNRGENVDDLFQVGCIGLIKAIDNFDLSQNVLFSTYAVPMIIGEIRRHLRDNNSIRVSRSLRDIAYKTMQAKEALTARNNKEPTIEEKVDEEIKGMNLREKIGQMLVISYSGTEYTDKLDDLLNSVKPGGFILFKDNISSYYSTVDYISRIKDTAIIPMLMSVDQEGGRVQRIKDVSDVNVQNILHHVKM